jgi:hypothetical protein
LNCIEITKFNPSIPVTASVIFSKIIVGMTVVLKALVKMTRSLIEIKHHNGSWLLLKRFSGSGIEIKC